MIIRKLKAVILKYLPQSLRKRREEPVAATKVDEVKIVSECFRENKGTDYTMIDVGAHWGSSLINFAKNDWRVFGFEPDPVNREKLAKRIEEYPNVSIDQRAVSDVSGDLVSFFTSEVSSGISGMSSFHESHVQSGKVETIRLSDFCAENEVKQIDFLKIDTEGFDLMVLKGFDWNKQSPPKFIVTEFEDRKTLPLGYSFLDQVDFLQDKGYFVIVSEWNPIVEYGVQHKWKRFVKDSSLVNDPAAWGNLIACRGEYEDRLLEEIQKLGYSISN